MEPLFMNLKTLYNQILNQQKIPIYIHVAVRSSHSRCPLPGALDLDLILRLFNLIIISTATHSLSKYVSMKR